MHLPAQLPVYLEFVLVLEKCVVDEVETVVGLHTVVYRQFLAFVLVAEKDVAQGIEVVASATCPVLELLQGGFEGGVELYGVAFLAQLQLAGAFGGRVEIVVLWGRRGTAAVKYGSTLRAFGRGAAYGVLRTAYPGAACYQQQREA